MFRLSRRIKFKEKERNLKNAKKENETLRSYDNQKLREDFNLIRLPISVREVVTDNNKFCTYYTKTKTMIISLLNLKRRIYVDRRKKDIMCYMLNMTR